MKSRTLKSRIGDRLSSLLTRISPLLNVQYRYRRATGRWFDPRNPVTFDEKLLWLMLYWHHPLKSRCADKYAVRSYVEEVGLAHLLAHLHGVYVSADEIDFSVLPNCFVLKATHGSGFNIVCRDKSTLDLNATRNTLEKWLHTDISRSGSEVHYADIQPRIVCEEFLEDAPGAGLSDYKVYCFSGEPHCTMACTERTADGALYDFYDLAWQHQLPYQRSTLPGGRDIPRPAGYPEMLDAARTLSKPFPFVRVDFYSVRGRPVFGEMTFTPAGCIDPDNTDLAQAVMGKLLMLPDKLPRSHGR
jgi:hypothetical protein